MGPTPPYRKLISTSLSSIVGDTSRAGPLQISGLRRVDSFKGPAWLACLIANANTTPRSYAVFFQGEKMVESRLSVRTDQCEEQAFEPFGMFAESLSVIR